MWTPLMHSIQQTAFACSHRIKNIIKSEHQVGLTPDLFEVFNVAELLDCASCDTLVTCAECRGSRPIQVRFADKRTMLKRDKVGESWGV